MQNNSINNRRYIKWNYFLDEEQNLRKRERGRVVVIQRKGVWKRGREGGRQSYIGGEAEREREKQKKMHTRKLNTKNKEWMKNVWGKKL